MGALSQKQDDKSDREEDEEYFNGSETSQSRVQSLKLDAMQDEVITEENSVSPREEEDQGIICNAYVQTEKPSDTQDQYVQTD